MLDIPTPAVVETDLLTLDEARPLASHGGALATLLDWLQTYPVNGHDQLGRAGVVCPFTRPSSRLNAMRVRVETCMEGDDERAFRVVRDGLKALTGIPVERGDEHFRTIVMVLPNCASEAGIATLERAMRRHKYYCLLRMQTIGLLHPTSEQEGLWNRNFRPMRAPLPVLALRYIIEQDARFVAHYHLQWAPYLLRFGLPGARRLAAELRTPNL
jgi:hypothetical protein